LNGSESIWPPSVMFAGVAGLVGATEHLEAARASRKLEPLSPVAGRLALARAGRNT